MKNKYIQWILITGMSVIFTACGSSTDVINEKTTAKPTAKYVDAPIEGVHYECGSESGETNSLGEFHFEEGKSCTFSIRGTILRKVAKGMIVSGAVVVEDNLVVARFLQTLDIDGDPSNGITISPKVVKALDGKLEIPDTKAEYDELVKKLEIAGVTVKHVVTEEEAEDHLASMKKSLGVPEIELFGANPDTVIIGSSYSDPGAIAEDYKDGNIEVVSDASDTVNTSVAGEYTITYTAIDSDKHIVTTTRTVVVVEEKKTDEDKAKGDEEGSGSGVSNGDKSDEDKAKGDDEESGSGSSDEGKSDEDKGDEGGSGSGSSNGDNSDDKSDDKSDEDKTPAIVMEKAGWYLRTVVSATTQDGKVYTHKTAGVFGVLAESEDKKDRHDLSAYGEGGTILQVLFTPTDWGDDNRNYFSNYKKYDENAPYKRNTWKFKVRNARSVNLADADLKIELNGPYDIRSTDTKGYTQYEETLSKDMTGLLEKLTLIDLDDNRTYSYDELKNANLGMDGTHTRTFRWVVGTVQSEDYNP